MADLHNLLAIYVHAHRTGNSVPSHIDAEARAVLAAEPPAPAEPVATLHVSDFRGYENYDFQHLVDLPPGRYELFTACTAHPPAPVPADHVPGVGNMVAADGERKELAQWLDWLLPAFHREHNSTHASNCLRAAALLRQPAPAPVPGWQPISTAPRDGTEILASDYDAIEIVNWNCDPSPWDSQTGDGPAWCDRDGLRMFPAWWQPLPDHPPIPTPTKPTND